MENSRLNDRRNKIVRSGFSSILQVVVAALTYIIIYVLILDRLGRAQLGVWSIITSIPTVVAFLGSGVAGSLLRYIPIYLRDERTLDLQKIVYNGLLFNLVLGLLLSALAYIFSKEILGFMFGLKAVPAHYLALFDIAILTFFVNFLSSVLLSALDGMQEIVLKNKIVSYCSIAFCITAALLILYVGLVGVLIAQLFQAISVLMVTSAILHRKGTLNLNSKNADRTFLKLFYHYGGRLQYVALLNILFEPITKYFLNRYFSLSTVGTYDLVNRVISLVRTFIVNAVQTIVPFVSGLNDGSLVLGIYEKSIRGTMLISSILFGGLITSGFSLIYGFEKINSSEFQLILIYLSIGYFINILSAPAYSIRLATGKLGYLFFAQLLSTSLNTVLFLALGSYLHSSLMLLPTCVAVAFSSLYVILSYRPSFHVIRKALKKNDQYIYLASFLFPLMCILASQFNFDLAILAIICFIHAAVVLVVAYKNEYLRNVIHILVKKENKVLHE